MNQDIPFKDLTEELKKVGFETPRAENGEYFEAVFVKDRLPDFMKTLEGYFGPVLWPAGQPIPAEIDAVIKKFGGIMGKQTLFGRAQNGRIFFAMLWPWGDGVHITLKAGYK